MPRFPSALTAIVATGLLAGCASTDLTRASARASSIHTPAQAVVLLAGLNSLKMDLAGSLSKDLNPCQPDVDGLRTARFLQLVYAVDAPNFKLPPNLVPAHVYSYKFGQNPITLPGKAEFESKHALELQSALHELVSLQGQGLRVHYTAEVGIPIFNSTPASLGDHCLLFKDVARLVTKSYPQGRGRIQFYHASGTHLGSLFFEDADFTHLADIQAALLVLCPNVK